MFYSKERVIEIELRKAREIASEYEEAERKYRMARGLVSEREETILLDNVFIHARVLVAHIRNLDNIDSTVKFYNTSNTIEHH